MIFNIHFYYCAFIWLVLALLEHLVIGVPLIVFFGLISLYLASQLQLYVWSGILIGSVIFAFLVSLSSWFTVLRCYHSFKRGYGYDHSGFGTSTDGQLTQPLFIDQAICAGPPNTLSFEE